MEPRLFIRRWIVVIIPLYSWMGFPRMRPGVRRFVGRIPLPRQRVLLFVVALFARGDDVAFGRFSAPHQGDQMIHCEFVWCKFLSTIMADARGALPFPPLGLAECARLIFFALNCCGGNIGKEWVHIDKTGCPREFIAGRTGRTPVLKVSVVDY